MMIALVAVIFLSGCWSSIELDETALVHGIGLSKDEDKLLVSMEFIKPGDMGSEGASSAESLVLEQEAETLIEASREMIRKVKRRPSFEHNQMWVISEDLARDDSFVEYLDSSRRDEMFRINSNIFISKEEPINILNTSTLYNELSSVEIISALRQEVFIAGFTVVKMYEFFKQMEGPIPNAYIPMIRTSEENQQTITELDGTAVIKEGKMVGELTDHETNGLNVLNNQAKGGYLQVDANGGKVSLEVQTSNTTIDPVLKGNELEANIQVEIVATLADNHTHATINKKWLNDLEEKASELTREHITMVLDKLQNELQTDITGIGMETYRKYPNEWKHVKGNWDAIFAAADVNLDINTEIHHQGLNNKNVKDPHERPYNNPYKFNKGN